MQRARALHAHNAVPWQHCGQQMRRGGRPAAAARPTLSPPPAVEIEESPVVDGAAPLPVAVEAPASPGQLPPEKEQPAREVRKPQQERQEQAPVPAAAPGKEAAAAAAAAAAAGSTLAVDVWASRIGELVQAAQQTAVRLWRQLEPPPPGFPPGPPGDAAVRMLQQPLDFLQEVRRRHGGVAGLLLGGERAVLVADPAVARVVLLEPPGRAPPFVKEGTAFFPGSSLTGDGLLTSDGEVWRRQRRLVNPAFRRAAVDRYAEAMLRAADRTVRTRWRDGWVRDVYADFNALTLEIAIEALFGGGGSTSSSQALASVEITGAIQEAFGFFARRGAAALAIPEWVPTPDNLGFNAAVARLDRAVYGLISDRRRELAALADQAAAQQGRSESGGDALVQPRDLLDGLLLAAGEAGECMGDRAARDELMTLLIAGQETSAILLGWACAYLAHHPAAQEAAAAEVRALLRGRSSSDGESSRAQCTSSGGSGSGEPGCGDSRLLEAADSRRLPFVEAVVLEAMRLSPPAHLVGRCAAADTHLAGYYLQKGTTVLVCPYLLHRDPAVWGPDAAAFRPERWLELARQQQQLRAAAPASPASSAGGCPHSAGASTPAAVPAPPAASGCPHSAAASFSSSSSRSSSSYGVEGGFSATFLTGLGPNSAYVPFGAGQRNCVGTGFAMTEAILVLAAVLDRFRLHPLPGAAFPEAQPQITLRPASVPLLLRRRWE
ncbi:hypothetical protein ABPG75_009423 [Micractinium tetrahymenae]